jgi:hypothetical protein
MLTALLHHLITPLLVMFYSLLALVRPAHTASNLALGKPYTVSRPPSYILSAPPTDTTSLTDGVYTAGYFWTQKTTVGWHPVPDVEILIDLQTSAVIDSISFSTARGEDAGVKYPAQIHAFVGPDKSHLLYVGDIAGKLENLPGPYQVKKFTLSGINARGRYVLLSVVASVNRSIFCDEIEVLQGGSDAGRVGSLTLESARRLAKSLRWPSLELNQLNAFLAESGGPSMFPSLQELVNPEEEASGTLSPHLLTIRRERLGSRFPGQTLLVEEVSPWSKLSPYVPITGSHPGQLQLVSPSGGYDHRALLITNLKTSAQKVSLALVPFPAGAPKLFIHHAPFVRSAALEYVPDPLLPEEGFTLLSGESRLVLVSVRGDAPGAWSAQIRLTGDGATLSVPLSCQVSAVSLPEQMALNAVNWGYLTFGLISDRRGEAAKDLLAHWTSVVVVPPSLLKGANMMTPATAKDFLSLESYLKYYQGATKLLLGLGFGTADRKTVAGRYPFLGMEWQDEFKRWYASALLTARRAGFTEHQIYLYPYDEMAEQQIDDFVKFAVWAKSAIPGVKLYATFGESTLRGKQWGKALLYLDIVQWFDGEMPADIGRCKAEAWIYNTRVFSRSLSPYSYYRLMAWKAFLKGYTGIGFWAYADTGEETSAWKELQRDFAVIYEGPKGSIVSSRRWEAWRMGIEDYELLKMYAANRGEQAAKTLAKTVYDHPEDTSRADEVRRKILVELSSVGN